MPAKRVRMRESARAGGRGLRARVPELSIRGEYLVPVAGLGPLVTTAQEATGLPPGMHTMQSGLYWRLLYTFTPQKLKVGKTGAAEWYECAAGTAVLIPHYTEYRIDTRGSEGGAPVRNAWLMLQYLDESPVSAMVQNSLGYARVFDPTGLLGRQILAVVDVTDRLRREAFWPMQYAARPVLRTLERSKPLGGGAFEVCARAATTVADSVVPGVVEYLQRRLDEPVTIAEIANAVRLSVSTVSHVYRKLAGETPMQTQRRLRIQRVKVLLVEGWSLEAAADATGFCDARHASREFKRSEGLTPSDFVRQMRENVP